MRLIDADALIDNLGAEDEDIYCKHIIEDAPTVDAIPTDILHTRCHPSAELAFQRKMFGCLKIVPVNQSARHDEYRFEEV